MYDNTFLKGRRKGDFDIGAIAGRCICHGQCDRLERQQPQVFSSCIQGECVRKPTREHVCSAGEKIE